MTNNGRPSRFTSFAAMGNGSDKPSQPIGTSFSNSSSFPTNNGITGNGIWGNNTGRGIMNAARTRDAVASRDSNDTFSGLHSGSGALAATSEAEPWPAPGPWNTDSTQTRSGSGNTSPNRPRAEPPMHMSNGSYFSFSSRPKPAPEPSPTGVSKYPQFPNYTNERENTSAFGQSSLDSDQGLGGYSVQQRSTQDLPYGNPFGSTSHDPNKPPSSHSETNLNGQGNGFSDFTPFGNHAPNHTPNSTHSQRPSITGHPQSFPSQVSRGYNDLDEFQENISRLTDSLNGAHLNGLPNGLASGLSNLASYNNNGAPQPFQFNPVSQPWDNGEGYGSGQGSGYPNQFFPNSFAAEKRGSIANRGSPAASSHPVGLNSPRSYTGTGTPQPGANAWSRPASRDPRNGPDLDRRGGLAQTQFVPQQAATPFYPSTYNYPHNYPQFTPPMFDQYATNLRPGIPMSGYGMPLGYLGGAAGVPHRPGRNHDPVMGVRSPLLEEFRSSAKSNKRYELKDIYDHIVEFSGDQHGSRFIQNKLETANSDDKDQVFCEIQPNAVQLMKDVFGNYVIQKCFEHGSQAQKKALAGEMKGKVVDLSLQMYACRVVQKALEYVLVEQQAELVKELESDVMKVVKDQNGNHVVQKVIEVVPRRYIGIIMDCLKGQVRELASHSFGCRVIQRVLEHGSPEDKKAILDELHNCAQVLVTDQYGNYVTQHVIERGEPEDRSKMIRVVVSHLVTNSKHKFASNVVEKCINHGDADELRQIREGLTALGSDGNSTLQAMMKDNYGNYVIQKLLEVLSKKDDWAAFLEVLRPQILILKKQGAGKQLTAIENKIRELEEARAAKAAEEAAKRAAKKASTPTPSSSAPASPGATPVLQVDVAFSAVPTPNLTMEPNSPSSSPSSSTDTTAVEEATTVVVVEHHTDAILADDNDVKLATTGEGHQGVPSSGPQVHVDEA
ncbi:putative pumilio domain-protein [Diplogelasinospora grovesii]|uniref:Pumilio homology domain family member 3 n=1 Tax=Diplogelasinospora grovesii TaxID=303347 RepID=A0AAN6N6Z4_9PEZI|nr:putative pumilio domain-protein [Diplogelasinospora grovesii]